MRFWDASAIVPLLMSEPSTRQLQSLAARDPAMLVWWGTELECASAIARLEREGALDEPAVTQAFERLKQLAGGWHQSIPAMPFEKQRSDFFACIRCALRTRCSLPRRLWPRNAGQHRSK